MAGDEVEVAIGVEEGHVIVPDTAVYHFHQTGSGDALHFDPEFLRGTGRAVRTPRRWTTKLPHSNWYDSAQSLVVLF